MKKKKKQQQKKRRVPCEDLFGGVRAFVLWPHLPNRCTSRRQQRVFVDAAFNCNSTNHSKMAMHVFVHFHLCRTSLIIIYIFKDSLFVDCNLGVYIALFSAQLGN